MAIMSNVWTVLFLHCLFCVWKVSGQIPHDPSGKACPMALDVIIILDSSGSVGRRIWPKEVDFAKKLVNHLSISKEQTHVGILDFSSRSILRVDLNKPISFTPIEIQKVLDRLKTDFQGGVTYMDKALNTAIKMFQEGNNNVNRNATNILVMVTDGRATGRNKQTGLSMIKEPVRKLKALNVNRIAIGVGKNVKLEELQLIASYKGNIILVSTFIALINDIAKIFATLCPLPLLPIADSGIDEIVRKCPENIDIFIILDCSGSIGPPNWERQLSFVRRLVQDFTVAKDKTRFGLSVFHEMVKVYIDIEKEGWDVDNIFDALLDMKDIWRPYMRTYTDLAIAKAAEVFSPSKTDYPRLILLLTDGETSFWRKDLLKKPVEALSNNKVEVLCVGVGTQINNEELLFISKTKDKVFTLLNYKELLKDINRIKITNRLCQPK